MLRLWTTMPKGEGSGRWQDRLLSDYDAAHDPKRIRHTFGVNLPLEWLELVQTAAEARDISVTAFVRRAAMAITVADLSLDWETLMKFEPRIRPYTGLDGADPERAEGYGHGNWRITGLGEYVRGD